MAIRRSRNRQNQKNRSRIGGSYLACPDTHPNYCEKTNNCVKEPRVFLFNTLTHRIDTRKLDHLKTLNLDDGNWIEVDRCNLSAKVDNSLIDLIHNKDSDKTHAKYLVDEQQNKTNKKRVKDYKNVQTLLLTHSQWYDTVLSNLRSVQDIFRIILGTEPTMFDIILNGTKIKYDIEKPTTHRHLEDLFGFPLSEEHFNNITFMEHNAFHNCEDRPLVVVGHYLAEPKREYIEVNRGNKVVYVPKEEVFPDSKK